MGGEELNSMAIRIPKIDEHRVAGSVTTGSMLDAATKANTPSIIASMNDMAYVRHNKRNVVQPRPGTTSKNDVVWIALALQKDKH